MKTTFEHQFQVGDIVRKGDDIFKVYNIMFQTVTEGEVEVKYNLRPPKSNQSGAWYAQDNLRLVAKRDNCEDFN